MSEKESTKCVVHDANEVVLQVSKQVASLSLGFSLDCGNTVTKLIYRSKADYNQGKPKDVDNQFGKLRLRFVKNDDAGKLIEFLNTNCDIMDSSRKENSESGKSIEWLQIGMSYHTWKETIESSLNIRTVILSEPSGFAIGLQGFYRKSYASDVSQQTLPISPDAVARGRNAVRHRVNMSEHFRSAGEVALGDMMNRPRAGFDLDKYNADLMSKSANELAAELQLVEIQYPIIFVVMGSVVQIYHINKDGKSVLIDFLTAGGKMFYHVTTALTGAKDFNDLAEMIGRGRTRKVDEHSSDLLEDSKETVEWFSGLDDAMLINVAGKLGKEKYKDKYSKDDIAASLALSFCHTTSKLVAFYAHQHGLKSVVFCGTFLCHPGTRACLDEAFTNASVILPYSGGDVIKFAILSNPEYICALGAWQRNLELEQEKMQKKI